MVRSEVLRAGSVYDSRLWLQALSECPRGDVYFSPAYARIYERHKDGEAFCFVLEAEEGRVLYPFLLRRIPTGLAPAATVKGWLDTANPYGYGGPLICAAKRESALRLAEGFSESFHSYCIQEGIVAEFARLHPLLQNAALLAPESIVRHDETVFADLAADEAALWAGIRKGHKSSIKRAGREGIVIGQESGDAALTSFYELYSQTMERNGASAWYSLSKDFFADTLRLLEDHIVLLAARQGGRMTNAALFMRWGEFAHYHFAGAAQDAARLGGGHLLVWEAIKWARRLGARYLHLGGGLNADDSLFRFKSGFASGRATFYTRCVIHNADAYGRLVDERARRSAWDALPNDSTYFPQYRS